MHSERGPRRPAQLDPTQQAVVDHPGGPLLVLAGPGTGKTTTIVEAVAARIDAGHRPRADPRPDLQPQGRRRAAHPDHRPGRPAPSASRWPAPSTPTPTASSAAPRCCAATPRPACSPSAEQDAVVAELLRGDAEEEGAVRWPAALAPALGTAGFRTELRDLLLRATERGVGPDAARRAGAASSGRDHWVHAAAFQEQYEAVDHLRHRQAR